MNRYQQLISAAQSGALILTANERLFRYLRSRYDQAMQQSGKDVWGTPQIISYQGWLSRCLAELGESWRLLDKNPALRLWERLIEDSSRGTELELLQVPKTAEKAYEAHQLLREHEVGLDGCFLTEDQRVFKHWQTLFSNECKRQEWLDRSELSAYICQAFKSEKLLLPAQVLLVGFDQLPPGAVQISDTFFSLGCNCEQVQLLAEDTPQLTVYAAQDEDHEIEQAARWARHLLEQSAESVGVVVFGLQAKRRKIERVFRNQIDPAAAPGLLDEEANFTLSLGSPLAEQGVIHAACELLALGWQLSLDQVSFLLHTPYLGGSCSEAESRAQLETKLRSFRQPQLKLISLENLAKKNEHLKSLAKICEIFRRTLNDKELRLPGAWAEQFTEQLQALGWPGERTLASREYQAIKAWREKLLPALATLDSVSRPIGRGQALSLLRRLAADIDFQIESPTGALQVVGQLESAGLHFDHLWVLGLSEKVLPAVARPNPFIPYELQQRYEMPHASGERELRFAEQVIERLKNASPQVVFSYPSREGDCELRPSPLIPQQAVVAAIKVAEPQDALTQIMTNRPILQLLSDEIGPPLADGKGSGGTGILKDQAHCPFRAFVHHRLRGRELDKAAPGLDAMTRGDLVHLVLERLWQKLKNQQALLELDESRQSELLRKLIRASLEDFFADRTRPSAQLLVLEQQRLEILLTDWLDSVESKRDPFDVVEMEQEHIEQFGPLEIKTKIDRIDQLADGSRVIIDYKTGSNFKADDLLSDPLLEPQLPIYAVAEKGAEADGVAFAQVRRSDCRLLGVVKEKGLLGRVKPLAAYPQAEERNLDSWSALLDDWRRQLESLASDFVAGKAEVRPYDLQRSCQYCDLPGLCRITEAVVTEGGGRMIADALQRKAAIDVNQSCIVQAPAGSGKTELLIQRFLALLAEVERPNQILAITFTRKAAAEMSHRLLEALTIAKNSPCPEKPHEAKTWQLADRALKKQGEQLLRNPAQLSIQTIDSFNASLVRKMPWLSRFGALPELTDDAENLYQQAAEQLLKRLDSDSSEGAALCLLLGHLDNHVGQLQKMLVDMLKRRDQWLRYLLKEDDDPRTTLETGLKSLIVDQLQNLQVAFPAVLADELLFCSRFAAANLDNSALSVLATSEQLPGCNMEDFVCWQAYATLLLTGEGKLRKTVNVKNGFPSGKENSAAKQRMIELLRGLEFDPVFVEQLKQIRDLPAAGYADNQWQILQCLIELLPLLVAELWLVFRGQGKTDFAAIALQAKAALGAADNPTELLLRTDNDLRHVLVDEFQDTSWLQYELLGLLTSGWSHGDGRTLFLVGDPMQSIYRFREAEVGLFLQTFAGQLGASGPLLKPLQLCCNFRSQQGIVDWVNSSFAQIFPAQVDAASGAVALAKAEAVHPLLPGPACTLYPFDGRDDQAEAEQILQLVQRAQAENPQQKTAILVRGRAHLQTILPLLREQGLKYQAQDIDQLGTRPAALDLLNLCKAILHRADRLAWLSVLRAPWCGLSLHDLHALVADTGKATVPGLLKDQQRVVSLSAAGRRAVGRIWPILQRAISRRGRLPLRDLLEGAWLALGGPACYPVEAIADTQLLFGLLETLEQGGDLPSLELLESGLQELYAAPDSEADDRLQVMTIHKAKGLQFDTVILPGLGKTTGRVDSPLLRWQQHPQYGLLLAPVAARGSADKDPIYQLIGRLEKKKQELEASRLLYVATTRAVSRLHLLGHAKRDKNDDLKPAAGSLLEKLWPIVEGEFVGRAINSTNVEEEFCPPLLRRLTTDWQMPELTTPELNTEVQQKTASQKEDAEDREIIFSGWESESKRHAGTLVHQYLEQIARFGADRWWQLGLDQKQRNISRQLSSLGVPATELPGCIETVLTAVEKTLMSNKGKWIVSAHPEHASELELTGMVDGQLMHAVIDRTFVADGIRWVIDYKTSLPKQEESVAAFIVRQQRQYQSQMQTYAGLMKLRSDSDPIRSALYFPLIDCWCEMSG